MGRKTITEKIRKKALKHYKGLNPKKHGFSHRFYHSAADLNEHFLMDKDCQSLG
jgi:hypothetical protein